MAVVAAGMHTALMARCKWQAGALGYRQGVHIAPEGQGIGTSEVEKGADRAFDRRKNMAFKTRKDLCDIGLRLGQIAVELRYFMQIAPVPAHAFDRYIRHGSHSFQRVSYGYIIAYTAAA